MESLCHSSSANILLRRHTVPSIPTFLGLVYSLWPIGNWQTTEPGEQQGERDSCSTSSARSLLCSQYGTWVDAAFNSTPISSSQSTCSKHEYLYQAREYGDHGRCRSRYCRLCTCDKCRGTDATSELALVQHTIGKCSLWCSRLGREGAQRRSNMELEGGDAEHAHPSG